MIDNAKTWATARGLFRTNEVHGAEEFKVPTFSGYEHLDLARNEQTGEGALEVDDPNGTLFDFSDVTEQSAVLCRGSLLI